MIIVIMMWTLAMMTMLMMTMSKVIIFYSFSFPKSVKAHHISPTISAAQSRINKTMNKISSTYLGPDQISSTKYPKKYHPPHIRDPTKYPDIPKMFEITPHKYQR